MGQQAAKISKIVSQRWNAEHRAFKVLDQNEIRPSVAPRYTSSLREPASEPVRRKCSPSQVVSVLTTLINWLTLYYYVVVIVRFSSRGCGTSAAEK